MKPLPKKKNRKEQALDIADKSKIGGLITKINYMEYILTEEDKKLLADQDDRNKRFIGRRDIEMMYGEESEKFDRRKFGKLSCGFCNHNFNPFYTKTIKAKCDFEWRWQGTEYKEPEQDYECNCPKCDEQLNFQIYVGQ